MKTIHRLASIRRLSGLLALALGLSAANAQSIIEVGGASSIGDTTLITNGGNASLPQTGANWSAAGGEGILYSNLTSPTVVVTTAGAVTLRFNHRYNFEEGWDGGAVYISINGGAFTYLPGTAFSSNGYVSDLSANNSAVFNGGEEVFTNASAGYSTPAYIESVANLGTFAASDTIAIRFRGGWDEATTASAPNWEISSVKISDTTPSDLLDATFSTGGASGFTVSTDPGLAGPWNYPLPTSRFEINADTLTADRYKPDIAPAVIDLTGAKINVVLLSGTLDPGDSFQLFDLSGGSTLTGTIASITLPSPGTWDTTALATTGTITYVAGAPNLTWAVGSDTWDTVTENWSGDSTLFNDDGTNKVTFNNPSGGIITVTQGMSPGSTTVDSAGTYQFITGVPPNGQANSIDSGTLVKNGSGTLRLGDSTLTGFNLYTNGFSSVTINAGTFIHGSPKSLGTGTITLAGGVTWTQANHEGRLNFANEMITNAVVLSGGATNDGFVNIPSAFTNDNKGIAITGDISGPGGFNVTGSAGSQRSLGLGGNNTFEGGVKLTVSSGNTTTAGVEISSYTALGTGTFTVSEPLAMNPTTPRGGFRSVADLPGNVTYPNGVTNPIVIVDGKFFNVYVATSTHTLKLGGIISGNGTLNKWKAGTVVLSGANTYTGGTRCDNGILTINGSLADATMSIIGGTTFGGTVNGTGTLTFNINGTTSDLITVGTGTVNGTLVATGLTVAVNPTGLGLTQPEYTLVSGGGTITGTFAGLTGAPGYELNYATPGQVKLVQTATPYGTWAATNATSGNASNDFDGDGVSNAVEFLLGGDKDTNDLSKLPVLTTTATDMIFTFKRKMTTIAPSTVVTIEVDTDLVGWTTTYSVPNTAVANNPGVTVIKDTPTGFDTITLALPKGTDPKKFARLKVSVVE